MKQNKDSILRFIIGILFITAVFFVKEYIYDDRKELYEDISIEEVTFLKKVDGDTAKFTLLNGKEITCRFLAIDTPETVMPGVDPQPFGKEASDYTEQRLLTADKIVLEYDYESDKYDKYDRVLAWVWVDDSLLQEELIANGYAQIRYIYGNYKYLDKLEIAEMQAKEQDLGIWRVE